MMKDVLRITFVVLATAALLVLLWWFRTVLVSFFMAVIISAMLAPAFRWFQRCGIPRLLAMASVYGIILLLLVTLSVVIYDEVLQDLNRIVDDLQEVHTYVGENWTEGNAVQRYVATIFPSQGESLFDPTLRDDLAGSIAGIGGKLTRAIILTFLVVVVSIYWSIEYFRLERLWLLLLPPPYRARARQIWRQLQAELGTYVRNELLGGVIITVILGVTFWWIGFPYPVVLSVVIAATSLVSWLGAFLAVMAVWAGSLLNFMDVTPFAGVVRVLVGSAITLVVFTVLKFVVQPRMSRGEQYSSLLLIVVTVGAVQVLGFVGIIVGPPISMILQIVARYLMASESVKQDRSGPVDLQELQARLSELQQRVRSLEKPRRLPLQSMLGSVSQLIDDTGELIAQPPTDGPAA